MPTYTTQTLLDAISRRAYSPLAAGALDAAGTLALATEELHSYLVPLMMAVRQEYFVASSDLPLVALQRDYRIPSRAVGGKLRDVLWVEPGGNVRNLPRLEPEAAAGYRAADTGSPEAFTLVGGFVRLLPTPQAARGVLRLSYFSRPGSLVLPSACAQVLRADYSTQELYLSGLAPESFVPGARLDVVSAQPGFATLVTELTLSSRTEEDGTTFLAFAALAPPPPVPVDYPVTAPEEISVGDWVCLAGEAPVPQVPPELHPLLALKVAATQLEALGDTQAAQALLAELQEKQRRALALLSPRVEGEPRRTLNGMARWRGRGFP